jgi:hypothetical protein
MGSFFGQLVSDVTNLVLRYNITLPETRQKLMNSILDCVNGYIPKSGPRHTAWKGLANGQNVEKFLRFMFGNSALLIGPTKSVITHVYTHVMQSVGATHLLHLEQDIAYDVACGRLKKADDHPAAKHLACNRATTQEMVCVGASDLTAMSKMAREHLTRMWLLMPPTY